MSKKPEKIEPVLETFTESEQAINVVSSTIQDPATSETKATIDGVWIVDGRLAVCESEDEARAIHRSCFHFNASDVVPSDRYPCPGERVLHYRGPDRLPYFGNPG
jgi:hypothetical protein